MGTEKLYYLGVKAFIQNKAGAVLLLKVNTAAFKNHKDGDYWDIPGGRVMGGEDVLETLRREVKEETGIHAITTPKNLGFVLSTIEIPLRSGDDSAGLILSLYCCTCDETVTVTLSSEHTDFAWVTLDEALERLMYKYPKDLLDLSAPLKSMHEDPK